MVRNEMVVHSDDSKYEVVALLPGCNKENVDIKIENDVLHIDGKISESCTKFFRSKECSIECNIRDVDIDVDNISAIMSDGVLVVTMPRKITMKKIPIISV